MYCLMFNNRLISISIIFMAKNQLYFILIEIVNI